MKNDFKMRLTLSSNPTNTQLPVLLLGLLTYSLFNNHAGLMVTASPSSANRNKENAVQPTLAAVPIEEDMTKAILDELQREGHTTKKDITPSKKFMIDLFSSLRREETLQNKSDHLPPKTRIHHSDTVRSFSAKVPSSPKHYRRNRLFYEFFIPVLPEHERAHVVEFRVLNSNIKTHPTTSPLLDDTPFGNRNRRVRRSWAVVVKRDGVRIYKDTRRYRPIKEGMYDVFDVTGAVASYLNENRGNLIIVIKERSRDETDDDEDKEGRDSSELNSCASPGNGLLVLYSRNSHFFQNVYERFSAGSAPTIAEHRQRRHSQENGEQHGRPRPRQKEKNKKNRKSNEKDKQRKRNKNKSEEIPCGRYDYTIDFDVIGWGKWIVAPKKFNAHLCSGSCAFDMEAKHNSSNHAMLQSLMRLKQPEVTPMPCCVPTKLRSISMMYFELGEIVVRKHQDVIAEECGCR